MHIGIDLGKAHILGAEHGPLVYGASISLPCPKGQHSANASLAAQGDIAEEDLGACTHPAMACVMEGSGDEDEDLGSLAGVADDSGDEGEDVDAVERCSVRVQGGGARAGLGDVQRVFSGVGEIAMLFRVSPDEVRLHFLGSTL